MKKKNDKNNDIDIAFLVQFCLVVAFLLFAVGFIIYMIGWEGITAFGLFGMFFIPLLIAPNLKSSHRKRGGDNYFLDPIYKGWLGNIFTKK